MKMSPAMKLLTQVWDHVRGDSWQRINWAMADALKLAIKAGMRFFPSDFTKIYSDFRADYWIGSEPEWVYTLAIESDSPSAFQAWEVYVERHPFLGPVSNHNGAGYRHASSINIKRARLAVGFTTLIEGEPWFITSFDDLNGRVRLAQYGDKDWQREGRPTKQRMLTHEEALEIWPAPKKKKKPAPDEMAVAE